MYYAELTADGCRFKAWVDAAGTACEEGTNGWARVPGNDAGLFSHDGVAVQCECNDPNPFTEYVMQRFSWCKPRTPR